MARKPILGCDIEIMECAKESCVAGKNVIYYEKEDRQYFALHYVTHGNGELEYNGETVELKEGDLFVVIPNKRIVYRPVNEWEYYWMNIRGKEALPLLKRIGFSEDKIYVMYKRDFELIDLFSKIVDSYYLNSGFELKGKGYFYLFMSSLIEGLAKPQERKSAAYYVQEAITYFQYNFYYSNVTLESLAKNLSVSKNYLCRIFKKETGFSPMQYLSRIRIKDACKRLIEYDYPIADIARTVGFSDPLYFSREFKRHVGMSPSKFRKSGNLSNLNL